MAPTEKEMIDWWNDLPPSGQLTPEEWKKATANIEHIMPEAGFMPFSEIEDTPYIRECVRNG